MLCWVPLQRALYPLICSNSWNSNRLKERIQGMGIKILIMVRFILAAINILKTTINILWIHCYACWCGYFRDKMRHACLSKLKSQYLSRFVPNSYIVCLNFTGIVSACSVANVSNWDLRVRIHPVKGKRNTHHYILLLNWAAQIAKSYVVFSGIQWNEWYNLTSDIKLSRFPNQRRRNTRRSINT